MLSIFKKRQKAGRQSGLSVIAGSEQNPHRLRLNGISNFVFSVRNGGQSITVCRFGSGHHLNEGDFVVFEQDGGETTRYKITERRTPMDPGDQHFLDCEFAPRPEPVPNTRNVPTGTH